MMHKMRAGVLIAGLIASAGLPAAVVAQDRTETGSAAAQREGRDFRSCSWLIGRGVVGATGDEVARVSDAIIDRGSGRVEHLVIKTGSVLGLGGKSMAIPYGAFGWDEQSQRPRLDQTSEQLKLHPEFSADEWSAMMESGERKSALREWLERDDRRAGDPYADALKDAKKAQVTGEIKSVDRIDTPSFGEFTVVAVAEGSAPARRVVLGPSWFVNGAGATPSRGDKFSAETLILARDPDGLAVATEFRSGGRELRLRESDGKPVWSLGSMKSGEKSYGAAHWRYLLASTLKGMKVECRGESCGNVDDIVMERRSGLVAFLSIDPDANFLGISDTKRLVPWSLATVGLDGKVRIDASKEMIAASPETPSEIGQLGTGTRADMVYKAYEVRAPRFEPAKEVPAAAVPTDDGWGEKGVVTASIDRKQSKSLTGTVVKTTDINFPAGVASARAFRVKSADGESTVIVGPAWYADRQKFVCPDGETVTIEACRVTINGEQFWIARSIECKGARTVLIENDRPAWVKK